MTEKQLKSSDPDFFIKMDLTESNLDMKAVRSKALGDANKEGEKQRFALFSQPPPVGLGDDSAYGKHIPLRDANGKVVTEKENVKVLGTKWGKTPNTYFSDLGYVTVGTKARPNEYMEPERLKRKQELAEKVPEKEIFKPQNCFNEIIKSSYTYGNNKGGKLASAYFREEKKVHRDENGKVISAPSNVLTNPDNKKLYKFRAHMKDEYDREEKLIRKQREEHHRLIRGPFLTTDYGEKPFGKDKTAYGETKAQPAKKEPKPIDFKILKHDNNFKPSNPNSKMVGGTIAKYPAYKADPMKVITKKTVEKTKEPFKPNNGGNLSRPTPTITCNALNIRKEIHH